ncbi:MAG: GHKL domain-containing protein [Lachnospiraceae bacterium]|nr:GHKL domain-containing protein [Lachnospiraceae bacterium]
MVIDLLSSGLSVGCFLFFIWGLIKPKSRYVNGPAVFLCCLGVFVGIGNRLDNLLLTGGLCLLLMLFYEGSLHMKGYLSVAYVSIRELVRFTIFHLGNSFVQGIVHAHIKDFEDGVIGEEELMSALGAAERIYQMLFFIMLNLICFGFLYLYKKQLRREEGLRHLSRAALLYLTIPALTGYVYCILFRNIQIIERSDEILLLDSEFPIVRLLVPLGSLLCLGAVYSSALLLKKTEAAFQKEKEAQIYKNRLRDMEQHIRDMERMYGDVKSMRHDLKNYVADMQLLAGQEKPDQKAFHEYLHALEDRMEGFSFAYTTGNLITDVVVNRQLVPAREAGVCVECEFCFPQSGGLEAFDLSILLNNALENAVEACGGEGEIHLASKRQGRLFLISVSNTCKTECVWRDGMPVSTKHDSGIHGYIHGQGLKNIEKTAKRYGGTMRLRTEDGMFILEVLLQLLDENAQ